VEGTVLSSNWLNIDEDVAYKRIMNCTNVADLRNVGKNLYTISCKLENKI
jgi:HKD family nuclease